MAQEGMWEHAGLRRGSGKSEGAYNTRRKERCWRAMSQGREPWEGNMGEGWLGQLVEGRSWEAESPILDPPPEQTCFEESGGREEGDSQVRCLVGLWRAGPKQASQQAWRSQGQPWDRSCCSLRPREGLGQARGRPCSRPGAGGGRPTFSHLCHTDGGHRGVREGKKRVVFGGENNSE